ncbi:phage head maturation protease [Haloactinospora alba]|uniref:Phage head maturation protease n=1 Tax=Haloactinospora alba TaxID=405555 RepID=A0A543NFL1_9ACTN|nr:HK97 family phage prohead protease [Haloactinospora alba]TQN30607.1 phage head maturation protease [Haloactinospora alba]
MSQTVERRAEVPPRDDVLRQAPFALRAADTRDDEPGDGLTLDGFAAVFNRESIIDSWEGRFREKISPGAMKKSFRENPPRVQFDHGRHPLIGSIPIASVERIAEETDPDLAPEGGAHVVGRLHDNWLIEPVRDAIAAGAVDGMSFRFGVVRQRWFEASGKEIRDEETLREALMRTWMEDLPDDELILRDLKELRVPEVGPVVWPAYDDTSVGVRSTTIDLGRLDDPDTRRELARAVLLADAIEQEPEQEEESPHATEPRDEDSAGEHDETPAREAPPQEEKEDDEPHATARTTPPAGTHSVYIGGAPGADWYLPPPDNNRLY